MPFFIIFDENVKFFRPEIHSVALCDVDIREDPIWYMQDNTVVVHEFLENVFPGQVIATNSDPLAWPPRSPDLNPVDFFLWGHLKLTIYKNVPYPNLQDHRTAIQECFATITHLQVDKNLVSGWAIALLSEGVFLNIKFEYDQLL